MMRKAHAAPLCAVGLDRVIRVAIVRDSVCEFVTCIGITVSVQLAHSLSLAQESLGLAQHFPCAQRVSV